MSLRLLWKLLLLLHLSPWLCSQSFSQGVSAGMLIFSSVEPSRMSWMNWSSPRPRDLSSHPLAQGRLVIFFRNHPQLSHLSHSILNPHHLLP